MTESNLRELLDSLWEESGLPPKAKPELEARSFWFGAPATAAAQAYPSENKIIVNTRLLSGISLRLLRQVLLHEIAHLISGDGFHGPDFWETLGSLGMTKMAHWNFFVSISRAVYPHRTYRCILDNYRYNFLGLEETL